KNLDVDTLSEDECESILKVIQRDFDLRQQEQDRLHKIEEELNEEDVKATILAKKGSSFNENCCVRCFSRFFFIFNQKNECAACKLFVCKNCATYDKEKKAYTCKVCQKQTSLQQQSNQWFYQNVKQRFKRFGSAKVVRSLYKR
ncbi:hypothetical protein CAPTEDRAFT_76093, partial [Capitella teleta]